MSYQPAPEKTAEANVRQSVPFFRVQDIQRSLKFYVDGLGFSIKFRWTPDGNIRWCWLENGGASLMLQDFWSDHDKTEKQPPPEKRGVGVSVCFMCGDALAIYHQAKARGLQTKQ